MATMRVTAMRVTAVRVTVTVGFHSLLPFSLSLGLAAKARAENHEGNPGPGAAIACDEILSTLGHV